MQIGDQVLFKGYSRNPAGHEPVLEPGDACIVEMVDGDVGLRIRRVPAHPRKPNTEWVFVEEVMPLDPTPRWSAPRPDPRQVFRMMANENTKAFADLRDRTAYMYVTGAYPTNMRPFFTGALTVLSEPCRASGRVGPFLIDSSAIHTLNLRRHPMVVEARRLLSEGWRLVVSFGANHRRPYGNLYFACGQQRLTVNAEGWAKPGWPLDWERRSTRR